MKKLRPVTRMSAEAIAKVRAEEKALQEEKALRTNAVTLHLQIKNGRKLFSCMGYAWSLRKRIASDLNISVMAVSWKTILFMVKEGEYTTEAYTNSWEA